MITLPAQRLRMGSTTYFLASMPARQLAMVAKSPSRDLPEWDDMSVEDRFQRDVNTKRLHDEVIPYLATHPDRFFGSVIILVDGEVAFEELNNFAPALPYAYQSSGEKIGFLTIDDSRFTALDGQHRLVALREIFEGRYRGDLQPGIANDDLSVIFIQNEDIHKTRRIFNKVNRYARSTSRSDNLILSEDDGYAIISRRLFSDPEGEWFARDPRHAREQRSDKEPRGIVNWKNNTLSGRSVQLTTISALSLMVKDICEANGIDLDEKSLGGVAPDKDLIDEGYKVSQKWFAAMFSAFSQLDQGRRSVTVIPECRENGQPYSFLFRPAGQISLFRAARRAKEMLGPKFDIEKFMKWANSVDWKVEAEIWRDIIVVGGQRIMAKQNTYEDAALMILWIVFGRSTNLRDHLRTTLSARLASVNPELKLPDPLPIDTI
jgi:DNA sulfur modification protein DndB